jgi:branched-chain amino acid transport system substrate-binding protein
MGPRASESPVRRRTATAAAVLVAALALAACGGSGGRQSSYTLKVGQLVPLTGDLARYGPAGKKAGELAADHARRALKATGTPIKLDLLTEDSETQQQTGELIARKLILDEGSDCVAGDWAASGTNTAGNEAAKDDVPLITPASTNFQVARIDDRGYVFRTAPPDQVQVFALADVVAKALGGARGKTVSLAARRDVYGTFFAGGFASAWEKLGGRIQGPTLYDPAKLDYAPDARKIVAGHPDAFVVIDFPETYAKVAPYLVKTGRFDASRMFTSDTMVVNDATFRGIPLAAIDGARGTEPTTPRDGRLPRAFDRLWRGSSLPPRRRMLFDAQNFDAVTLCFLGSIAAGSNSGASIKDALPKVANPPGTKYTFLQLPQAVDALRKGRDIDYQGVTGPLDVDSEGDPTVGAYDEFVYRGGRPHVVREFFARKP